MNTCTCTMTLSNRNLVIQYLHVKGMSYPKCKVVQTEYKQTCINFCVRATLLELMTASFHRTVFERIKFQTFQWEAITLKCHHKA